MSNLSRTESGSPLSAYALHVQKWKDCTLCPLCTQRYKIVFARGTVPCNVLFIGEAPGPSENLLGQPFKGPAGHLLDESIIEPAWRIANSVVTYALTNLVLCFPQVAKTAGTNEPTRKEILACQGRLREFIGICKPKLLVNLGALADTYVSAMGLELPTVHLIHPASIIRMNQVAQGEAVRRTVVSLATALENLSYA